MKLSFLSSFIFIFLGAVVVFAQYGVDVDDLFSRDVDQEHYARSVDPDITVALARRTLNHVRDMALDHTARVARALEVFDHFHTRELERRGKPVKPIGHNSGGDKPK